ncbi:hypothetical protein QYF36_022727 [Acer negundo]|nr:hypothetical protein QYF36_022727 [Acer negundo]
MKNKEENNKKKKEEKEEKKKEEMKKNKKKKKKKKTEVEDGKDGEDGEYEIDKDNYQADKDNQQAEKNNQQKNDSNYFTFHIYGFQLAFQAIERITRLEGRIGRRIGTGFPRFKNWDFNTRVLKVETYFSTTVCSLLLCVFYFYVSFI